MLCSHTLQASKSGIPPNVFWSGTDAGPRARLFLQDLLAQDDPTQARRKLEALPGSRQAFCLLTVAVAAGLARASLRGWKKAAVVSELLLWYCERRIESKGAGAAASLHGLPVKGTVSLRALWARRHLGRPSDLSKEALIAALLRSPGSEQVHEAHASEAQVAETLSAECESVRNVLTWMDDRALSSADVDQRLQKLSVTELQGVALELSMPEDLQRSDRRPRLLHAIAQHIPDFQKGLPWVPKQVSDLIHEIAAFQQQNDGALPKRAKRRTADTLSEDRLAQRWRRFMNRKDGVGAALAQAEVEFAEAVLGSSIWYKKGRLDQYLPGYLGRSSAVSISSLRLILASLHTFFD